MSTQIECPGCGAKAHVVERMMGRSLRCPKCGEMVQVPTKAELEANLMETSEFPPSEEFQGSIETVEIDVEAEAGFPDRPTTVDGSVATDQAESFEGVAVEATATQAADQDDVDPPPLARKKRDEEELDMTPMVDVTFLLLIFFMVTASFSLQKSIAMPHSQSDQPSTNTQDEDEDQAETVTVEIDEFNGYLIIASTFERECTSKLAVTTGLTEAFNPSGGGMRLAIVCHEKAKLQSLVDVMDAGTIANYTELQITEVEELD